MDGAEIDWDFSNNSVLFGVDGVAGAANADLTLDAQISNSFGQHGDQLTLSYTITNRGPESATGVELGVDLPDEFIFVSGDGCTATDQRVLCVVASTLAADESVQDLSIVVELSAANQLVATTLDLFNLVVDSASLDRSDGNNVVSIKDFVIQPVAVVSDSADLSVVLSGLPNSLNVGSSETFTVEVTNSGLGGAENVIFSVALPANIQVDISPENCAFGEETIDCSLGDLPAGSSDSLDLNVSLMTLSNEFLTLSVVVSSDSEESDETNNSDVSGNIATFGESVGGDSNGGSFSIWMSLFLVYVLCV